MQKNLVSPSSTLLSHTGKWSYVSTTLHYYNMHVFDCKLVQQIVPFNCWRRTSRCRWRREIDKTHQPNNWWTGITSQMTYPDDVQDEVLMMMKMKMIASLDEDYKMDWTMKQQKEKREWTDKLIHASSSSAYVFSFDVHFLFVWPCVSLDNLKTIMF